MFFHQALSKNAEGLFEIDMNVIRQMADAFDQGAKSDECLLAKFIVAAYETGFDHGMNESNEWHLQTALLMACTAGNA